ncbi:galactose oxidase [Phanerochaete sordida]|uniref:Galactose oxidase n=1 Tax=Phanerochaete sordida TaxID=48140 RepID=A0A9P3LLH0_9APHY|nr:galactose oxidase [Phanerochaete sordida]
MYPIADLTAFCRRTSGDVPPKLVGASTTVVGSKMYLYGGRLVAERKMVSDIYMFDLETLRWEKIVQSPEDDVPQARYFHSADAWNNHLLIFGGMAISLQSDNPEDLCVLNDVRLFDLSTYRWLPSKEYPSSAAVPKARYAHLSSVTANKLFIIGGQDLNNVWLDDIHVYDLSLGDWIIRRDYPRHCGTYRSVAVTADKRVRLPQEERRSTAHLGPPGARFNTHANAQPSPDVTQPDSLVHLPYSADPTDEFPCDIFLFSNYNFTDVQRELEVFTPLPNHDFTVSDRSTAMTGQFFPPGLRFPTGAILGTHFIVAGTYLSQSFQSFSIWALDLVTMTWSRIDPGSTLSGTSGSWFRSCLWTEANKYLVFGNRHGNLVEDYNRRLLSWEHVIVIDLEAFGIYQPPPLVIDIPQQELGLAALEEGVLADFEIICDDGRKIKCSRKLLEDRWPWFKKQRQLFLQAAARAIETAPSPIAPPPLPDVHAASDKDEERLDPRLTPRAFSLSEPYPITLAFLQYLYSMALLTPLQHAPAVLSQLLLLSSTYDLPHLQSLVKHAMHRALTFATSVGIYGVSTLCNCRSLQIRALRVVMAYSQKRPTAGRSRQDKDGSGGSRHHESNGSGSGPGGPSSDKRTATRPRGMSDASYMQQSDGAGAMGLGREYTNGTVALHHILSESNLAMLLEESKRSFRVGHRSNDSASSTNTATGSKPHDHEATTPDTPTSPASIERRRPTTLPARAAGHQAFRYASQPSTPLATHVSDPLATTPPARPPVKSTMTHVRSGSMISMATEEDIVALADILSPTIETQDLPPERLQYPSVPASPNPNRLSIPASDLQSLRSYTRMSAMSAMSSVSSMSSMSDQLSPDGEGSDGYFESAYLSTSPTSMSFHLPRFRPRYLSDTPSLATSESYSIASLSTPPMSRAPSVLAAGTPPMSPASTSFVPTPLEPASPAPGLGVIFEGGTPDDEAVRSRLERALTLDDVLPPHGLSPKTRQASLQTASSRGSLADGSRAHTPEPDIPPPSLWSETDTVSSGSSAHGSGGGRGTRAFSKIFARAAAGKRADSVSSAAGALPKDEEKRRKKQEAKERRERLAFHFQQQAADRAAAAERKSLGSDGSSSKHRKRQFEEENGMYEGLGL